MHLPYPCREHPVALKTLIPKAQSTARAEFVNDKSLKCLPANERMLNLLNIFYYRQSSEPTASAAMQSTNLRSKLSEKFKKKRGGHLFCRVQAFALVIIPWTIQHNDYLHSICIALPA